MGRHEGGGRGRRDREKPPRVDVPGVPHVKFPFTLERQYPRQMIQAIKGWDQDLYEYDAAVAQGELSLGDTALYVQMTGLFEQYAAEMPTIASQLNAVGAQGLNRLLRKNASLEQRDQFFNRFYHIVVEEAGMTYANRPLFMAVFRDMLFCSREIDYRSSAAQVKSEGVQTPEYALLEHELASRNVQVDAKGVPRLESVDPLFINELSLLSACAYLRQELQEGHIPEKWLERAEQYTADADEIAKSLQGLPITQGRAVFPEIDGPLKGIIVRRTKDLPMTTSALVGVNLNQTVSLPGQTSRFPLTLPFAISRITGDLAMPNAMLLTPEKMFKQYGLEAVYPAIRHYVLSSMERAVLLNQLTIEQDAFQTAFTLRTVDKDVVSPTMAGVDITELPEAPVVLESVVAPVEVEEVPQPLEEVNREEEFVLRERRAKAERLRTVKYRKAKSALERLGVTFESGGRHLKARYNGISTAFPNSHSGKNADITYILRSVLEILGISEEDFIREL